MSSAELAAYAPGLDWDAWFAGADIGPQQRIIVNENSAIRDLAALYAKTPLDTLKLWKDFHVSDNAAPYLSQAFVDRRFDFTRALSGVSEQREEALRVWKEGGRPGSCR